MPGDGRSDPIAAVRRLSRRATKRPERVQHPSNLIAPVAPNFAGGLLNCYIDRAIAGSAINILAGGK
jgi:hypothetical protein